MRIKYYIGVKLGLQIYISSKIIPMYKNLDKAHGIEHIAYVINRSIKLAKVYRLDINMMYCIAAFHDIGMIKNRLGHEILGAEILGTDNYINRFFSIHQIETMKSAINEHRASYKGAFTSVYSKAISEADRSFDIFLMTYRSIAYGMDKYPEYTFEQHFDRTYDYLQKKYGKNGYSRMVLYYEPDSLKIEQIQRVLDNREMFREVFVECYRKCVEKD